MREYLDGVMERSEDGARFEARVARNALGIAERELRLGPAFAAAHAARLAGLGFDRRRRAGRRAAVGRARRRVGIDCAGARRVGP